MRQPVRKTILVVDDEKDVRESICLALTSVGYDVDGVHNGKEALVRAIQQKFDAAILDIRMPELTGFDVMHALKKLSPDTILIMLTAMADPDSQYRELTKAAGAYYYMQKPCKVSDLRRVLENAFDEQKAARGPDKPELEKPPAVIIEE